MLLLARAKSAAVAERLAAIPVERREIAVLQQPLGDAVVAGALEGQGIADAVLAGRLG
mgnify:CR=1 FL=1